MEGFEKRCPIIRLGACRCRRCDLAGWRMGSYSPPVDVAFHNGAPSAYSIQALNDLTNATSTEGRVMRSLLAHRNTHLVRAVREEWANCCEPIRNAVYHRTVLNATLPFWRLS